VRNKVALALLVLAAMIVVSACGGTQEANVLGSSSTSRSTAAPNRRGRSDPNKSCDAQGINATQLNPGACTEAGIHYVVANFGGAVQLRTLAASIVGVSVSGGYRGPRRTIAPRYDAFLRISLEVQNRDRVAHHFGLGQTMLGVAGDNYLERTDIESRVHPEALVVVNNGLIGPGETLRGDVIFDITEADYQQLQQRGRFFIWNFGRRASAQIRPGDQVGQIRLYAGEAASPQSK